MMGLLCWRFAVVGLCVCVCVCVLLADFMGLPLYLSSFFSPSGFCDCDGG